MPNTATLANTIHEAYKADGGPVRIHVNADGITCVEGQGGFFKTVGGYDRYCERTRITHTFYDAPDAVRSYS